MRRNHLPTVTMPSLRTNRRTDPANSGLFALFQEISGSIRLRGGPGRIRTSNQTVMSGRLRPLREAIHIRETKERWCHPVRLMRPEIEDAGMVATIQQRAALLTLPQSN
jgi:hypothetical protein